MDFTLSDKQVDRRDRVLACMDAHICPALPMFNALMLAFGTDCWHASMRTLRLADGPDEGHNRTIARIEYGKYRAPQPA